MLKYLRLVAGHFVSAVCSNCIKAASVADRRNLTTRLIFMYGKIPSAIQLSIVRTEQWQSFATSGLVRISSGCGLWRRSAFAFMQIQMDE